MLREINCQQLKWKLHVHAKTVYIRSYMQISQLHIHKLQSIISQCAMIQF